MHVSVVICTWNRADLLDRTLAQFRQLEIPDGVTWELLVVNNRCTDNTDGIIEKHVGSLPISRLYEQKSGKSHAANTAIEAARGELILWTDDDVLVEPKWLKAYAAAAKEHPEVSFFGGTILPWFAKEPPAWIARHMTQWLYGCYAIRRPDSGGPIRKRDTPFGANMATRRSCFEAVEFNSNLGPRENSQVRGEETELLDRLLEQGKLGLWVLEAVVCHFIPSDRLTSRFVRDWFRGYGRAEVILGEWCDLPVIWGLPRYALRRYFRDVLLSSVLWPFRNSMWMKSFIGAASSRGVLEQSTAIRRSRRARIREAEHRIGAVEA
jgi:glucosyl-dolichyl phosphate glucuronosyltransferase